VSWPLALTLSVTAASVTAWLIALRHYAPKACEHKWKILGTSTLVGLDSKGEEGDVGMVFTTQCEKYSIIKDCEGPMTVAELIEKLLEMPGEAMVLVWGAETEDGNFLSPLDDVDLESVAKLPSGNFVWSDAGELAVIL
jgi:hypothetical protein